MAKKITVRELVTKWGFEVNDAPLRRIDARIQNVRANAAALGRVTRNVGLAYAGMSAGIGLLLRRAGNFEQIEIGFETLIQNVDKSRVLIEELTDFAQRTPFQLTGLFDSTKRLLAFGIEAEKIIPTLTALGNIAAGVGRDKLPQLILAFGQVAAKTKLQGQEIRQFTEAGVPLIEALAIRLGVAQSEVQDLAAKGEISFAEVDAALQELANGSGRFTGLMERQSQTLLGLWSNLVDAVEVLSIQIGQKLMPEAKQVLRFTLAWVDANKELIKTRVERFVRNVVTGMVSFLKVLQAAFSSIQAVVRVMGGWENVIRGVTIALSALVAVRVLTFLGSLGMLLVTVTRNLAIFIIQSRTAALALGGLKLAALALPLALGAAFAFLFLILEDLVAYFQGRDSVVGGLINDFQTNGPAFFQALDNFEKTVLGKVQGFVDKFVAFFTDDAFAQDRQKLVEAILMAFDVALAASATLARIGYKIGLAIFNGILEVFNEKIPGIAGLFGLETQKMRSTKRGGARQVADIQQAQFFLEKGFSEEDILASGISPDALSTAKRFRGIGGFDLENIMNRQLGREGPNTEARSGILNASAGIMGMPGVIPINPQVTNNVNINGSQLNEEQLKRAVGDGINDAMERTFRETERTFRSPIAE